MAAPTVQAYAATNIITAADPWTVNMPASIAANDLIIYFLRVAGNVSVTAPTGAQLVRESIDDASDDITQIWAKLAAGTEGATESIDLASAAKGACIVARITGHDASGSPQFGNSGQIVQGNSGAANVGTTANANPAALTPTGGAKDYLFMTLIGMDHETATFTAPSGYTSVASGNRQANSGTAGAVATNCQIAVTEKATTGATSEDPGAWTSTAPTNGWVTITIAVYPALPLITNVPPSQNRAMGLGASY